MKKMFILSLLIGQGMLHAAEANQTNSAEILKKGAEFRDLIDQALKKDPYLATLTENAYAVIKEIQKANNYNTIEPIFKAIYLDHLKKNPEEKIIVSQRLSYLLSRINMGGLYKLPDISIDISEYINRNGPIQQLNQRKGTIAYLINKNRPFSLPAPELHNKLYNQGLTVLDLWNLPNPEDVDSLVLTGNNVTSIAPDTFDSLKNLKLLYLDSISLPNGIFRNLKRLEMVNVNNNPILIEDLKKSSPSLFTAPTEATKGK